MSAPADVVSPKGSPVIPVVILNWNGDADTLACLRSIRRSDRAGFVPVLVDNGSAPESRDRLRSGLAGLFDRIVSLTDADVASGGAIGPELASGLTEDTLVFIQNSENYGFAGGNNVAVRLAECLGLDWVMLLNNDTVVAPDAFRELRRFIEREPSFVAATPQIRHMDPGDRIQNCGGHLTWLGSRRYAWENREVSAVPATPFSVISFITGCALLFRHRVTGPLTEDFFFGEEDYEFSLRLKARGLRMACVHGAVVHHKGGASIRRGSTTAGAILVHYANRLTNVRNYYSRPRWHVTRAAAYAYLPVLLWRTGIDPRKALGMIASIESHLGQHRGVGREAFQAMCSIR